MCNTSVLLLFVAVFFHCTVYLNAYKILVIFPTGAISHQRPQLAVSEALANQGHHVTIIAPDSVEPEHPNITQINIRFAYEHLKVFDLTEAMTSYDVIQACKKYFVGLTDQMLSHEPVMKIFRNANHNQFDAVIIESLLYMPLYYIKNVYNTTLIGLSSLDMFPSVHEALGNSIHPILHASWFVNLPKNPTFFDRIHAFYWFLYYQYWFHYEVTPLADQLMQKYFPETKLTSMDLLKQLDFVIEGVSPVLDNTRPLLPNTVQIGFLHIKKPKPLPADLQEYLDNSEHGIIYLSFGSNVKSAFLKPNILEIIKKTIGALKYDILWKFENETLANKPKNVKISKWLPQTDLLAHKNVKLFITHGGQQSMDETIVRGVPVLVVPFFADQNANAAKMESLGIGVELKAQDITVKDFTEKILEVIKNPKYRKTIKSLAALINDTPMSPTDSAVWWIEYAIRNRGAPHLKYAGADMTFIEFYLLDIILVHILLLLFGIMIIRRIKNLIIGKKSKEKTL